MAVLLLPSAEEKQVNNESKEKKKRNFWVVVDTNGQVNKGLPGCQERTTRWISKRVPYVTYLFLNPTGIVSYRIISCHKLTLPARYYYDHNPAHNTGTVLLHN